MQRYNQTDMTKSSKIIIIMSERPRMKIYIKLPPLKDMWSYVAELSHFS